MHLGLSLYMLIADMHLQLTEGGKRVETEAIVKFCQCVPEHVPKPFTGGRICTYGENLSC